MNSLILRTTMRLLLPILLLYSVFLLLRGHNYSGGGFVGGLVAGGAFTLYALSCDVQSLKELLKIEPCTLLAWGLLIALLAGLEPIISGDTFLTGEWVEISIPRLGTVDLGNALFFDIGVYLVVVGVTLTILLSLMEE